MGDRKRQPKLITANQAYDRYCVTRAWLRQKHQGGAIRRTETHGTDAEGHRCVRYLYYLEDIERELALFSSRSQAHAANRRFFEDRW